MAGSPKKPIQISFAELCGVPQPAPTPAVNSAPIIGSVVSPHRLKEIADLTAGENTVYHSRTSTLKFTDDNIGDLHSASFVPLGAGYRGTFSLGNVDQAANCVNWTFKIRDSKIDNLQKGQTLTQNYKITISDGNGGTTSKIVKVVLVGTNDSPVITSGVQKTTIKELKDCAERENNFEHSGGGTVTFADVDTLDTHTRTYAPQSANYVGTFALGPVNQAANSISWTFTVEDSVLEGLADGETLVQRYDITINDGHGGTAMQTVTVCIVGTNDKPVIAVDTGNVSDANDLVYEAALAIGSNSASNGEFAGGTIKLSDADGLDDLVSVTINGTTVLIADLILGPASFAGMYGVLTLTGYNPATGVATYVYELTTPFTSNPVVDDGNNVETAADSFTFTLFDGKAVSAPATISIDIVDDVARAGENASLEICNPEHDDNDYDDVYGHEYDGYGTSADNESEHTYLAHGSDEDDEVDNDEEEEDDDATGPDLVVLNGVLAHEFGADQSGHLLLTGVELPAEGGFTQSGTGIAIVVQQNGIDVLLFELTDPATGEFRVTQLAGICHEDDDDQEEDDDDHYDQQEDGHVDYRSSAGNSQSDDNSDDDEDDETEIITANFILKYSVVDGDGDTTHGSVTLSVCCEEHDAETSDNSFDDDNGDAYKGIAQAAAPIVFDSNPPEYIEGKSNINLAGIFGTEPLDHSQSTQDSSNLPVYGIQPTEVAYFV